jgi:hypothetical protein
MRRRTQGLLTYGRGGGRALGLVPVYAPAYRTAAATRTARRTEREGARALTAGRYSRSPSRTSRRVPRPGTPPSSPRRVTAHQLRDRLAGLVGWRSLLDRADLGGLGGVGRAELLRPVRASLSAVQALCPDGLSLGAGPPRGGVFQPAGGAVGSERRGVRGADAGRRDARKRSCALHCSGKLPAESGLSGDGMHRGGLVEHLTCPQRTD